MTDREALRLLADLADWDPSGWVAADEVANRRHGWPAPAGATQGIGRQLAALERRGLVESVQREGFKMWRLSARVRALLGDAA